MKSYPPNHARVLIASLFFLLSRPVLPAPSPTPVPSIASGAIRVELEPITSGLHAPNDLTSVGDGRLFVDEQTGTIRILKAGALLPTPFLDLSARLIGTGDERGLLGFTFHPGYNDPKSPGYGKFYTFTSEPISGPADFTVPKSGPFSHQNVVAEWQRSIDNPDLAEAASRREVLRVDQPQYSHNGSQLAFRPNEPYLYISLGDFIIAGSASEQVVLRGLGPSLVLHGVSALDTLSDPLIELHDGSGALIAANDDWAEGVQAGEISALGLAPNDGSESALLAQLPPGTYTTILKGTDAGSGIGLIEIYATSISAPVNPVNISTRGLVQAGDNVMIGGFILGGTTPRKLAVRAIGPSLGSAGVSNSLPDPILELHNQDGELIAFNDNWQDTQQTEIEAAGLAPTANLESAIVATLSPAPYTVVLRGKNNAVGVALVEAYQLDD